MQQICGQLARTIVIEASKISEKCERLLGEIRLCLRASKLTEFSNTASRRFCTDNSARRSSRCDARVKRRVDAKHKDFSNINFINLNDKNR